MDAEMTNNDFAIKLRSLNRRCHEILLFKSKNHIGAEQVFCESLSSSFKITPVKILY